jgi:hypothetical protein
MDPPENPARAGTSASAFAADRVPSTAQAPAVRYSIAGGGDRDSGIAAGSHDTADDICMHQAVARLRQTWPEEPMLWAPYIHSAPERSWSA